MNSPTGEKLFKKLEEKTRKQNLQYEDLHNILQYADYFNIKELQYIGDDFIDLALENGDTWNDVYSSFPESFVQDSITKQRGPRSLYQYLFFDASGLADIRVDDLDDNLEFRCRVLEHTTYQATKGQTFKIREYYKKGIKQFFNQEIDLENFDLIYSKLGNGINHELCKEFIKSNFNYDLLKK